MAHLGWQTFTDECRRFFDAGREDSLFPLIDAIDALYRIAPEKSPFLIKGADEEQSNTFAQCFFVCHRMFLSAATATGSSLPEDGEAITRRALEAAKTCLAIKADAGNFAVWVNYEKRLARWKQRGQGEVPKRLNLNYSASVKAEPLYEELQTEIGALSDFASHFTPEYFWRYTWEKTQRPEGGVDFSFGLREGAIELAFLMLSKHQELIIRVFDRCQDGRMLRHPDVAHALGDVHYLYGHFQNLQTPL